MKGWFEQVPYWGLGNFVMATPLLRAMYDKTGMPVPVYFHSKELRNLYKRCYYITVLKERPANKPFETSRHPIKRLPHESDSEALCRIHLKLPKEKVPHTFVPKPVGLELTKKPGVKYVAVFHGCLNDKNVTIKDIGVKVRRMLLSRIIAKKAVPVLLGTKGDEQRFWHDIPKIGAVDYLGKLRLVDSVSILSQCDCFISNDTGLYHVAGALNMKGLVLWTRTNEIKNRSPAKTIVHVKNKRADANVFGQAIDRFLNTNL